MQTLIDRDVVIRRPGMGTFVKTPALTHQLSGSTPFLADVFATGDSHEIRLLDFAWGRRPAPDATEVDGTGWLSVSRLYLRDDAPLAHALMIVPEPAGSHISRQDMEESVPLTVLHRLGVEVSNVHMVLTYEPADQEVAALLGVAPGTPCVLVTRRLDDDQGRACLWSWTRLPADRVRFAVDVATKPGAAPGTTGLRAEALA
jgi:GntR family transcriptional regulator